MVAYQPPDQVVLMIGASFRAQALIEAAGRVAKLVRADLARLGPLGITEAMSDELVADANDLVRQLQDPVVKKHDTPLQMAGLTELLGKVRAWLLELRQRAALNLLLDKPALGRVWSPMPDVADGYPRDVLRELEERVAAAKDLRPRLEDVGVDEKFVGAGRKLVQQLQTAIGKVDLDGANLQFKQRRLYMKKGLLYSRLKRISAAGQAAYGSPALGPGGAEARARYLLVEIEPTTVE